MSHLNTLSGGYKGGSSRVRSENSKKEFEDDRIKSINAQDLANKIKGWYGEGKLSLNDIQTIITELQKLQ